MPRAPRLYVPHGLYHVTARGNDGLRIFRNTDDRVRFLDQLGDSARRWRWGLYAWCLMGNHIHIVMHAQPEALSNGLQRALGLYAQWFNAHYGRRGHLFQRPFRSRPIEDEAHLWTACAYVLVNPVRAGLCDDAEQWEWSSYRATCGLERPAPGLACARLLRMLGNPADRRGALRSFVAGRADR